MNYGQARADAQKALRAARAAEQAAIDAQWEGLAPVIQDPEPTPYAKARELREAAARARHDELEKYMASFEPEAITADNAAAEQAKLKRQAAEAALKAAADKAKPISQPETEPAPEPPAPSVAAELPRRPRNAPRQQ